MNIVIASHHDLDSSGSITWHSPVRLFLEAIALLMVNHTIRLEIWWSDQLFPYKHNVGC